ncbi:MAG: LysR family transcriptional regulator [Lachnospiraceae bacterium]|nr:LysR family transcriptional regulator [Lachnospiraceae bacterium]
MEFRNMQYFIKLTECSSISQAARELYISQQALSKAIKKLEEEFETLLFLRTTQGIQLTEDGKYLKNKFKHICHNFEEAARESYNYFNIHRGNLNFCVAPGFFRSIPIRYLMEFEKQFPGLTLEQIEVADKDCENYVKADPHHFGLSTKPWHLQGFQFLPLYREQVFFIASKNHPLAHRQNIFLKELAEEDFLFFNNRYNIHYRTAYACKKAGFEPNIIYKSADVSQLVKLAVQNQGILICVKHVYEEANRDELVCIPIVDETMDWEIGIIFQDFQKLNKNAKLFIDYFISKLS